MGRKDSSGNVYVYVNDTDTEVMLSKRGLRHSLDRRLSIIAPVTENIGPIIKNSIRINELSPEFETIKNSYVLIGIAKNQKNEPYVVSFVVNRASNEVMSVDVLYAVNAKTEPAGSLSPELSSQRDVSLTGSTVSISDLLDYVNRYYPDILSEDVLRHYGYTARPDGVIGESAWVVSAYIIKKVQLRKYPMVLAPPNYTPKTRLLLLHLQIVYPIQMKMSSFHLKIQLKKQKI